MAVFIGTVIIVGFCCLAMSLGLLLGGKPFSGGCGHRPAGTPRCEDCPKRNAKTAKCQDDEMLEGIDSEGGRGC